MYLNLQGKVAVVTGGSKGIGYAIAETFLEEGAKVAICGRNLEDLKNAASSLAAGNALYYKTADFTDSSQIYEFAKAVQKYFGRIDIWVNNAGGACAKQGDEYDDEQIKKETNLIFGSVVHGCQAAFRYMKKNGGSIINISSVGARCAVLGKTTLYGPLKSAVSGLTNTFAGEYAAWNIRVNAVAPGYIATKRAASSDSSDPHAHNMDTTILFRPGLPKEVAKPVVFLASDAASFITATTLEISGGRGVVLNPLYSYEKMQKEEDK